MWRISSSSSSSTDSTRRGAVVAARGGKLALSQVGAARCMEEVFEAGGAMRCDIKVRPMAASGARSMSASLTLDGHGPHLG
mmetsp:Transcript_5510/g.10592  ORF Transcript_5510/g.10592 Transcript_5510/m.10592 type:complete len:81 (-) Transcript_5510:106-348(-)